MSDTQYVELDERMQTAVEELKRLISSKFPVVSFSVHEGEDSERIHLDATVDMDDPDAVLDFVIERLVEMQVEQGLPVVVIPMRAAERNQSLLLRQA